MSPILISLASRVAIFCLLLLSFSGSSLEAVIYDWTSGSSGNFEDGSLWDQSGAIPGTINTDEARISGGNVFFDSGNTIDTSGAGGTLTVGYDASSNGNLVINQGTMHVNKFEMGKGSDSSSNLLISAGNLIVSTQLDAGVSSSATAKITQTGGQLTANGMEIAWNGGSQGNMTMSSGNINMNAVGIMIGRYGDGWMTMSAGNITNVGAFDLAYYGGSTGNMVMSGGNINASTFAIGRAGRGDFQFSGGNITCSSTFYTSTLAVSSNVLHSGGHLEASGASIIGRVGDSIYDFSGGTIHINDHLYLGNSAGSNGNLIVRGGNLSTDATKNIYLGWLGSGQIRLDSGFISTSRMIMSDRIGGEGTYVQNGGVTSISGATALYVGEDGAGHLQLNGGDFNAGTGTVHISSLSANGLLEVNGGNLTCGTINAVSSNSILRIKGPSANVSCGTYTNTLGTAEFQAILSANAGHFTAMTCTGAIKMEGHFKLGLDGGLLVSSTNTFDIMLGSGSSGTYASSPSNWNLNVVAGSKLQASLSSGNLQGTLDMNTLAPKMTFSTNVVAGHIAVSNIGSSVEGMVVFMDVQTGTETTVLNQLISAGYSAQAWTGTYDIAVQIHVSDLVAGSGFVAWDFTNIHTGSADSYLKGIQLIVPPLGPIVRFH